VRCDEVVPVTEAVADELRDGRRVEPGDLDASDEREVDRAVALDAVLRGEVFLVVDADVEDVARTDDRVLRLRPAARSSVARRGGTAREHPRHEEGQDEAREERGQR